MLRSIGVGSSLLRAFALAFALSLMLIAPVAARGGTPARSDGYAPSEDAIQSPRQTQVNLYLVELEGGTAGNQIGCGDRLVAGVTRIPVGGTTAKRVEQTLSQLLAIDDPYYGESGLYTALYQSDLHVGRVTIRRGVATINLTGTMQLGGVCDEPRVEAQLRQTVLQFPGLNDVMFLINGRPLSLGGRG